jgi:hypothetical protein
MANKHGTRKSRAAHQKTSWRGKAADAHGKLWDAQDHIAELEAQRDELLESLKAVMDRSASIDDLEAAAKQARAAIAKAEGTQNQS